MSIQKPLTPKRKAQADAEKKRWAALTPTERKILRQASTPTPKPRKKKK